MSDVALLARGVGSFLRDFFTCEPTNKVVAAATQYEFNIGNKHITENLHFSLGFFVKLLLLFSFHHWIVKSGHTINTYATADITDNDRLHITYEDADASRYS